MLSKGGFICHFIHAVVGGEKLKIKDIEDVIFCVIGGNRSHTATNSPSSTKASIDATTGQLTSPNGSMKSSWGEIEFLEDGHYIYFNTSSGVLEGDFKKGDKLSGGTAIGGYTSVFAMKIKD